MWVGGLERCPWERSDPESAIARRASVPTGEVGAEKRSGAAEEPCPAGAEVGRRVVAAVVLVDDESSNMVVRLRGARGCATGESGSQGGGECRTRERAWQLVLCCSTVSRLRTCSNVCVVAGEFFVSVNGFVCGTGPDVGGTSFESIRLNFFFSSISRRCVRRRHRNLRRVTSVVRGCTVCEGGLRGRCV